MRKHHPKNERIKRQYLAYLEEAKRMSTSSADQVAAAIALFEASTGWRDFGAFHIERARKFKRLLADAINPETGKPLAKATAYSRLMALKAFFLWLAGQPGYKSRLTYSDADYFNPSNHDGRIAKATIARPAPTLEQISSRSCCDARRIGYRKARSGRGCLCYLEWRARRRHRVNVDASRRPGASHRFP